MKDLDSARMPAGGTFCFVAIWQPRHVVILCSSRSLVVIRARRKERANHPLMAERMVSSGPFATAFPCSDSEQHPVHLAADEVTSLPAISLDKQPHFIGLRIEIKKDVATVSETTLSSRK